MTITASSLTGLPSWKEIETHCLMAREFHLRNLFGDDHNRGTRLTAEIDGVYLDYSKNRITEETLRLLMRLAQESGLRERIDAMFSGEKINRTENRAVLH